MSVFESFRARLTGTDRNGDSEQLADGEPDPKGEHRDESGWMFGYRSSNTGAGVGGPNVEVDYSDAPERISEYWEEYYQEFALTRAALSTFDSMVAEPGYRIIAKDADGERDEDMTEALDLWASNCVIHAGEWGHDLTALLEQLPSKRRGKGTLFVEKVGTTDDPGATAALMMLDPSTFRIYKRDDQNILVQPGDDVDPDHPRTEDGDAAAYVQYDEELSGYSDKEPIPFAATDLVKLVYEPNEGEAWGNSIFRALEDPIDALQKKLDDRNLAIEQTGHPHRIYHSENWSMQEAEEYAKKHEQGEVSARTQDTDGEFAGRVDFVNDAVEIETVDGQVADLDGPVRDDIEQIFSLLPVGKYQIAYSDDINQFVVEPQQQRDDRLVDDERRYIERKFEPVFEEKADELAGGEYGGEVNFSIESPPEDNPLAREDFPRENLKVFADSWAKFKNAGVGTDLPAGAYAEFQGFDLEDARDEHATEAYEPEPIEAPGDDAGGGQPPGGSTSDDVGEADSGAGGDMPEEGGGSE